LNLEVTEGRFREDLFWRLNVLPIALPPLRRRDEDIELLVKYFLESYSLSNKKEIRKIDPEAMKALVDYQWPGNVRELQNYIERAVVLAQSDQLVPSLLPTAVIGDSKAAQSAVFRPTDDESLVREYVYNRISKAEDDENDLYQMIVDPVEKEVLMQVMQNCNQTQTKAATKLGINRNTLYKKLVDHGLAKSKSTDSDS
jgi:DNA-binding NtrC family response regulator